MSSSNKLVIMLICVPRLVRMHLSCVCLGVCVWGRACVREHAQEWLRLDTDVRLYMTRRHMYMRVRARVCVAVSACARSNACAWVGYTVVFEQRVYTLIASFTGCITADDTAACQVDDQVWTACRAHWWIRHHRWICHGRIHAVRGKLPGLNCIPCSLVDSPPSLGLSWPHSCCSG